MANTSFLFTPSDASRKDGGLVINVPNDGSCDFDFSRESECSRITSDGSVELAAKDFRDEMIKNTTFNSLGPEMLREGVFRLGSTQLVRNFDFSLGAHEWILIGEAAISGMRARLISTGDLSAIRAKDVFKIGHSYSIVYEVLEATGSATIEGFVIDTTPGVHEFTLIAESRRLDINSDGACNIVFKSIQVREFGEGFVYGINCDVTDEHLHVVTAGLPSSTKRRKLFESGEIYRIKADVNVIAGSVSIGSTDKLTINEGYNATIEFMLKADDSSLYIDVPIDSECIIDNLSVMRTFMNWDVPDTSVITVSGVQFNQEGQEISQKLDLEAKRLYRVDIQGTGDIEFRTTKFEGYERVTLPHKGFASSGKHNTLIFRGVDSNTANITSVSMKKLSHNIPTIDHSSGSPVLLLEKQSTNKIIKSTRPKAWVNVGYTVTANHAKAPNGTISASLITPDTADIASPAGSKIFQGVLTKEVGERHTISVYVKSPTSTPVEVAIFLGSYAGDLYHKRKQFTATDQWQRIELTGQSIEENNLIGTSLVFKTEAPVLAWGAQIEEGRVSSFINTNNHTVTRLRGRLTSRDISPVIGPDNTLLLTFQSFNTSHDKSISLYSASGWNSIQVILVGHTITVKRLTANQEIFSETYTVARIQDIHKLGIAWNDEGDFKTVLDGVSQDLTSVPGLNDFYNRFDFQKPGGLDGFEGMIHRVEILDDYLTDVELIQATT